MVPSRQQAIAWANVASVNDAQNFAIYLISLFFLLSGDNLTTEQQEDVTSSAVDYFRNLFNQLHALKRKECAPEVIESIEGLLAAEVTLSDLCREAMFKNQHAQQVLCVCYCYITKPYRRTINVSMDLEKLDKLFQAEVFKGLLQTSGCDMYVDVKREDIANGKFGLHVESPCLDDFVSVKDKVEELLEDIATDGGLITPPPIDEDVVNEVDRPRLKRKARKSSSTSESSDSEPAGDESQEEQPAANADDWAAAADNNNQDAEVVEVNMDTDDNQATNGNPDDVTVVVREVMEHILDQIDGQSQNMDATGSHEQDDDFAVVSQVLAETVLAVCELVSQKSRDSNTAGESQGSTSTVSGVEDTGNGDPHMEIDSETQGAASRQDEVLGEVSVSGTNENSPSVSNVSGDDRPTSPDAPKGRLKGEVEGAVREVNNNVDSGPDSGRGDSESDQDDGTKPELPAKPSAFQENTQHLEEQLVQMKINFYHRLLSTEPV